MDDFLEKFILLSKEKKELLLKKIDSSDTDPVDRPVLPRYKCHEKYPLTNEQKQIWMMHKMVQDKDPYNVNICIELTGQLDLLSLSKSFKKMIKKHSVFRTKFIEEDGVLYQIVLDDVCVDISEHFIDGEVDKMTNEQILQKIKEFTKVKFDLTVAPLIQGKIIYLKEDRYIFVIITHHIIIDGWSVGLILKELSDGYFAYITNSEKHKISPPILDYPDYAIWQAKLHNSKKYNEDVQVWVNELRGLDSPCSLPYDKIRPATLSGKGGVHNFTLDQECLYPFREIMKEYKITKSMFFFTVFSVLLYRYSSKTDFTIGMPVAGRTKPELQNIIGLFSTTQIFHCNFEGNPSFLEILIKTKEQMVKNLERSIVSLEKIVEELHPKRSSNQIPFFQIDYVYENLPIPNIQLPGLAGKMIRLDTGISKYDLKLTVDELSNQFYLSFEYSDDLFNSNTIELMEKHFDTLLNNLGKDVNQSIQKVSMISDDEKAWLEQWNMQEYPYDTHSCIHEMFENQVKLTPNNIAVIQENTKLTYCEFNCLVNQTANRLISLGIENGTLVGLCIHHSIHLLACIYALLKIGAVYIPINRQYPIERINMILEDTGMEIILSEDESEVLLSDFSGMVIGLEKIFDNISLEQDANLNRRIKPDQAAYILYTSGTTGRPKGVITNHRSVINHIVWAKDKFVKSVDDVWAFFSSIAHDLTVVTLFTPLICGNAIAVYSDNLEDYPTIRIVEDRVVTIVKCTPSHLELFKDTAELLDKSKIHCFIVGGAMLKNDLCKDIYKLVKRNIDIFNVCGPTETTVSCMGYHYDRNLEYYYNVPLGKPAYNVKVYILDSFMRLQPVGVVGELYEAGHGISPGYLNNPDLTASKFLANPFSDSKEYSVLYQSGDMGRWLPDGRIEIVGRKDKQIKIRGFRIELGDIESAIMSYESVQNVIVVLRNEDDKGERSVLCAYIVANSPINSQHLKSFIARKLPDYMLPRYYVQIPQIPLNLNGKVDEAALPQPLTDDKNEVIPQETNIKEKILIDAFEKILGVKADKYSNFFDLNGDSIKAIQIVSYLRKLNVALEIKHIFEYQTVFELADVICYIEEENNPSYEDVSPQTIKIPITPSQERMLFYSLFYKENQPFFQQCIFKIKGCLSVDLLIQCVKQLPEYYEVFKTSFTYEDLKNPCQIIREDLVIPCFYEDLSMLTDNEKKQQFEEYVKADKKKGFSLKNDSLNRFNIFKMDENIYQVLWSYHHIILDGWSIGNVVTRLFDDYYCSINNIPINHTPVRQYRDFINWLKTRDYVSCYHFWELYLSGYQGIEQLKAIKCDNIDARSINEDELCLILDERMSRQVKKHSINHRITLNSFFHIIWAITLMKLNSVDDIVFGTVVSGRPPEIEGIEDMVGLFVNTIPVRIKRDDTQSISEMMLQFNKTAPDLYKNSYISLLDLQNKLGLHRNIIDHVVVFENYKKMKETPKEKLGLEFDDINMKYRTNYDMNLIVIPDETIELLFQFRTDMFQNEQINDLIKLVENIIEYVICNPDSSINDILSNTF